MGSLRSSALQRIIQIIRTVERPERPFAAVQAMSAILQRGPSEETFAARAQSTQSQISQV